MHENMLAETALPPVTVLPLLSKSLYTPFLLVSSSHPGGLADIQAKY